MERDETPELEPVTIAITVNTSGFVEGLWKVRAAMLFSWHPEMVKLNDELSNLYGNSFD